MSEKHKQLAKPIRFPHRCKSILNCFLPFIHSAFSDKASLFTSDNKNPTNIPNVNASAVIITVAPIFTIIRQLPRLRRLIYKLMSCFLSQML